MKYRKLDASGDYTFGVGSSGFYADSSEGVAQAVETRLRLAVEEWFLDLTEGTPYHPYVLGHGTQETYDQALQQRIVGTPGVISLDAYASSLDPDSRKLSVTCTISTTYGQAFVLVAAENTNPLQPGRLDSTFILDQSALMA